MRVWNNVLEPGVDAVRQRKHRWMGHVLRRDGPLLYYSRLHLFSEIVSVSRPSC